ncbi:MAG: class I SAM-dependent methyltransferase, partial [Planctomycetota bacterium]
GGECYEERHTDKRVIKKGKKGFAYHWEQVSFNPINADASFAIHFKFADGSKLKNAFEYHWRFWTIPEVCEMLAEAGFSESHIYWEHELDEDGEETEWRRATSATSDPAWICYIVAVK